MKIEQVCVIFIDLTMSRFYSFALPNWPYAESSFPDDYTVSLHFLPHVSRKSSISFTQWKQKVRSTIHTFFSFEKNYQSPVGRPDNGPLTETVVCTKAVLQHVPKNKFDQMGSWIDNKIVFKKSLCWIYKCWLIKEYKTWVNMINKIDRVNTLCNLCYGKSLVNDKN